MKMMFTAATRPRIESGGSVWMRVWRTTTLTLSNAPVSASMAKLSQNEVLSPKTTVAAPNPATASSIARPDRSIGGRWAMISAAANAPIAGAIRRAPSPGTPTPSTSLANTGIRIVAPPSSTANRSSVIVPRITFVRQTNRTPSVRLRNVAGSLAAFSVGRRRTVPISPANASAQHASAT